MKHPNLTPFERDLFGAVFANVFVLSHPQHHMTAKEAIDAASFQAFEMATLVVQTIRSMDRVYGPEHRAEHEIQVGVFEQVKRRRKA